MTYRQYMGSAYWKKRKDVYFGARGNFCAVGGDKSGVTLHHKVYDHSLFGKEPDEHLIALCPTHRQEFHELHALERNMQKETDIYVAHARQVAEMPFALD